MSVALGHFFCVSRSFYNVSNGKMFQKSNNRHCEEELKLNEPNNGEREGNGEGEGIDRQRTTREATTEEKRKQGYRGETRDTENGKKTREVIQLLPRAQ